MKIGILTSSRADFGIYYPLVKELWADPLFQVEIIAFGTHLDENHGKTINEIKDLGFEVKHEIKTATKNAGPEDIAASIGDSVLQFSSFWRDHKFDLVIALGDRYEMFAAVSAASPFAIEIAHIHAGETTLGAIDNAYRHSISLMAKYLFVSTEEYRNRAIELIQREEDVFNVGALSIDNLSNMELYSMKAFEEQFNIDLSIPSILSTFHPETLSLDKNEEYIEELIAAFKELKERYQLIITMPNSDTLGDMIRKKLIDFASGDQRVKLVESFGVKGYLSAMKYCSLLLGNTSSAFVEAAFFPKWVINLGNRQKGRILTANIINAEIEKEEIIAKVKAIEKRELPSNTNRYGEGDTGKKIVEKLKELYGLS